ncbi:MAG: TAXI family TRAP transporter solute-binding subunit [Alphaproteobacteria bacterium]|nr:TAXI family TRAP transporter solute-binding subunit [Alphaproteobacteria bacterium]MBL6937535.1 TAXI family TRAP transporter solute-binding subunit [Alphaproteobacteria bacterium]MBL7098873.1 TAXI family TRAP transporter solute-binding subunit [Alphaproteobacteria bacterium]
MFLRRAVWILAVGFLLPALVLVWLGANLSPASAVSQRISFQILTGSTGGTYFPVGQMIAGLLSHPPGVDRCEAAPVCGPSGLIMTARTSDGAVANVLAVNSGLADSGFAQGDVVADAVAGKGAFLAGGKQPNVRVIADLFPEDVHLIVARNAKIASIADLKGKRVSLGVETSGTSVTVKAILAAYNMPVWRMKVQHNPVDFDAQLMQKGQLDAFFLVGGRPVALVGDMIDRGVARLVPIDGKGRDRLLKAVPGLVASEIPANTYRGTPAIPTVSVRALWIVNAKTPDPLVYGITRALFDRSNRIALQGGIHANWIDIDNAAQNLPAPLHPGALRFYKETGHAPH